MMMSLLSSVDSPAARQLFFLAGVVFALLSVAATLPRWRWSLVALAVLAVLFCGAIELVRRVFSSP